MSNLLRRWRGALPRLAGLFHKSRQDRDLSEEMDSHLRMQIDDNIRSGMSPEEARRQAVIKLGGVEQAKELYRDRRSLPVIETTLQDLRYGLRTLGKSPGFTLVAVATLALGVAANTTIFSMVSAILLKKPPIGDPDRVMIVASNNKLNPQAYLDVSPPDYLVWREQSHAFQDMAAVTDRDFTITGGNEPQRVLGAPVTAGYFRVMNVAAALGRTFLPDEDRAGHEHVTILSHRLWQSRFNSDPATIGKTVSLDGEPYIVIGVMPARFRLNAFDASLWTPLTFTARDRTPAGGGNLSLHVVARLMPGVSAEQAQSEMAAIARRLEERYPASNKDRSVSVMTLQEFAILDANVRSAMVLLMSAVVFVLLIACTNIANLLIARNSARQRELVIRAAVGAGRSRLVRQLLVESLLLGVAGGALGFFLAFWGTALLRSRLTWNDYVQAMASEMVLDLPVLGFCTLISIVGAIIFGLLPALQASNFELSAVLNESARGGSSGVTRRRLRSALVVAEIALSIILLTGAGVMIQALLVESRQALGFNPLHVLTAELRVSGTRYKEPSQQAEIFQSVVQKVDSLPGVEKAAVVNGLPSAGVTGKVGFQMEGQTPVAKDLELKAREYVAGPEYFRVMGIPLLTGRGFLSSDAGSAPSVIVINQVFAQRFIPRQDPVGKRISIDAGPGGTKGWSRIVGVAGDVRDFIGQSNLEPQIYESFLQRPQGAMTVVVRTRSDPSALASALRQSIWSLDKDQPISAMNTMTQVVDNAGMGDSLMGWLMGSFAGLALLLAGVGIFGVIAYNVTQRTREVGIRMALGAKKRDVLRLVVGQSALLTGLGVSLGMLGAVPLPNVLGSMFNGLPASPAPVLMIVPLLVASVSLLASYVPARRAMRVEPMTALRYE